MIAKGGGRDRVEVSKIRGDENPADLMKILDIGEIKDRLAKMNAETRT